MPTYNDDPIHPTSDTIWGGLTKREYFAALAAQGVAAHGAGTFTWNPVHIAQMAVKVADALIEELNKEKK